MQITVEWLGHAQHLCVARDCQFRLGTLVRGVSDYVISTVGEYYNNTSKDMQEIGWGRKYETFVFLADKGTQECGCPYISSFSEIDSLVANDAPTAIKNHSQLLKKYKLAARKPREANNE